MYFCFFATLGKVFAKPFKNIAFRAKNFYIFYVFYYILSYMFAEYIVFADIPLLSIYPFCRHSDFSAIFLDLLIFQHFDCAIKNRGKALFMFHRGFLT